MTDGVLNAGRVARVVLLACGSFNPITNMHLRMFGRFWTSGQRSVSWSGSRIAISCDSQSESHGILD